MTLEEFAKTKLSIRGRNVVMAMTTCGIWFSEELIMFDMKPYPNANVFDVFKHLSKRYLMMQPNCGEKTADEIVLALKEEGFELREKNK
jgi:hypothetical protein